MHLLPDSVQSIYPNGVGDIDGTPLVIFRDHRWTLPVLFAAGENGLLPLPATVVTFDRHRDLLEPLRGNGPLRQWRESAGGFDELAALVRDHCSPRDDDWIKSGMELGLVGDVVQFSSNESDEDTPASVITYADASGQVHRVFQLGLPARELTYKGGLVQDADGLMTGALKSVIGWDPALPGVRGIPGGFLLDIDLDFFTLGWQNYTLPFPDEVFRGEFDVPCQSGYYDEYTPSSFMGSLVDHAAVLTIACEPDFCGGAEKTRGILRTVDRRQFGGLIGYQHVLVDYPPDYPNE